MPKNKNSGQRHQDLVYHRADQEFTFSKENGKGMRFFFIGGSTSLGYNAGGKGFPHYIAENLPGASITMFLKNRMTASEALQSLRERNRELGKNDFYFIQLGAGDHYPLIQTTLFQGLQNLHISPILRSILRRVGFSKNTTKYSEYREIIEEIFTIIRARNGILLWIVTLQGYRFSPIERKKQRQYYRDVFFESKYRADERSQILDLNESLPKKLRSNDLIHPTQEGQIFITQLILNNLHYRIREDLR